MDNLALCLHLSALLFSANGQYVTLNIWLGTFSNARPDDGRTAWLCKEGRQTNIARIEVRDTPATFEPCICSLRSVAGGQNDVLNIEGFRHQFAEGTVNFAVSSTKPDHVTLFGSYSDRDAYTQLKILQGISVFTGQCEFDFVVLLEISTNGLNYGSFKTNVLPMLKHLVDTIDGYSPLGSASRMAIITYSLNVAVEVRLESNLNAADIHNLIDNHCLSPGCSFYFTESNKKVATEALAKTHEILANNTPTVTGQVSRQQAVILLTTGPPGDQPTRVGLTAQQAQGRTALLLKSLMDLGVHVSIIGFEEQGHYDSAYVDDIVRHSNLGRVERVARGSDLRRVELANRLIDPLDISCPLGENTARFELDCIDTQTSGVPSDCKYLLSGDTSRCWLFVSDTSQTWGDAYQNCIATGGHLVIEYNEALFEAIASELSNYDVSRRWWFGMRNHIYTNWEWTNGVALGGSLFNAWLPAFGPWLINQERTCARLSTADSLQWQPFACNNTQPFLCQYPVAGHWECTDGYFYELICFVFNAQPKTWYAAGEHCKEARTNGQLGKLSTVDSHVRVVDWLQQGGRNLADGVWIGLLSNKWLWNNGDVVQNHRWLHSEPKASAPCPLYRGSNTGTGRVYGWAAASCQDRNNFICEIPTGAAGSTISPLSTFFAQASADSTDEEINLPQIGAIIGILLLIIVLVALVIKRYPGSSKNEKKPVGSDIYLGETESMYSAQMGSAVNASIAQNSTMSMQWI